MMSILPTDYTGCVMCDVEPRWKFWQKTDALLKGRKIALNSPAMASRLATHTG